MNDFTGQIEKQLSRLGRDIQNFVEKIAPIHDLEGDYSPDCDIVESENEYRILIDLPGLSRDEIRLSQKDQVLRVSGERRLGPDAGETVKRSERKSGVFSRSFAIPEHVDTSGTTAAYKEGVLAVTIPKSGSKEDEQSIPIS